MDQMGMVVGSDLVGGYVDTASNNYEEMSKKELTAAKEEYAKSFGADAKVDGNKIIYTDAEGKQQERVFENEEEWISAMSAADVTDQVAKAMEQVPEMLARSSSALEGVKSGAGEAYEKAMS